MLVVLPRLRVGRYIAEAQQWLWRRGRRARASSARGTGVGVRCGVGCARVGASVYVDTKPSQRSPFKMLREGRGRVREFTGFAEPLLRRVWYVCASIFLCVVLVVVECARETGAVSVLPEPSPPIASRLEA